jgi:hypothetical protein
MKTRYAFTLILILAFMCLLSWGYGYRVGQIETWQDIISGKCWLNSTSRDIECIRQISR